MTSIDDVREQIDGLPGAEAAVVVRAARERFNQRRLALVEKVADLTRQLVAFDDPARPNPQKAARVRSMRDEASVEQQSVQEAASEMNTLLLDIEGRPEPDPSILKPVLLLKLATSEAST